MSSSSSPVSSSSASPSSPSGSRAAQQATPDHNPGAEPERAVRPSRGRARTLYVDTTGAVVRREGGHFQVDHHTPEGTETKTRIPVSEVDTIVLVGTVHCTTPALRLCLQEGIQVVLLAWHGRVEGLLRGRSSAQVEVRLAQYRALRDPERRMPISRVIVGAKLDNMETCLQRRSRRCEAEGVREAIRSIRRLYRHVEAATTREELMGIEGAGTRAYFSVWDALITRPEPEMAFRKRTRRPPQNAVNALLGFCYHLLQKDVHAACIIAGLDPSLGLLHVPRPTTPSAVLDLMEAFRPALVDGLVLSLVNRQAIRPEHVEPRSDGSGNRGIYLNEAGRKVVYRAYGRARSREVTPPGCETALPYYRVFELQARRLARCLTSGGHYREFRL